jgi:hypothetical protein
VREKQTGDERSPDSKWPEGKVKGISGHTIQGTNSLKPKIVCSKMRKEKRKKAGDESNGGRV